MLKEERLHPDKLTFFKLLLTPRLKISSLELPDEKSSIKLLFYPMFRCYKSQLFSIRSSTRLLFLPRLKSINLLWFRLIFLMFCKPVISIFTSALSFRTNSIRDYGSSSLSILCSLLSLRFRMLRLWQCRSHRGRETSEILEAFNFLILDRSRLLYFLYLRLYSNFSFFKTNFLHTMSR